MPEVQEFHQQGSLGINNADVILKDLQIAHARGIQVDVGLQVGADGRIWLCVNGVAFIRFKPGMAQMFVKPDGYA